jgi:AcrR family transcriptional regulator
MSGAADDQAQESGKRRRPGGRAAEVVTAVHAATVELLKEQGYERMEIPTIAERAAVNKTSIYRRWPSKAELVMDVALARMRSEVPLPDTGTLHGDLTALLRTIAAALSTPFAGGLLRALISREHEAGVAEARVHFWNERFRISGEVLTRAMARGELPAACDTRLLMEMAVAPLFFRALVTGEVITDAEIMAIVERAVAAFRAE